MNEWQQKYYQISDVDKSVDNKKSTLLGGVDNNMKIVDSGVDRVVSYANVNFVFNNYRFFKRKDAWYLRRVGSKRVYYLGKAIDFSKTYEYNE